MPLSPLFNYCILPFSVFACFEYFLHDQKMAFMKYCASFQLWQTTVLMFLLSFAF